VKGGRQVVITASGKPRRSGRPGDLRTEAPSGEVERYWDVKAFLWENTELLKGKGGSYIRICKSKVRISATAVKEAGFQPEDKVTLGRNASHFAIRKAAAGESAIPLRAERQGCGSLYVTASGFVRKLKEDGWDLSARLPVAYDKRNDMLVAIRPAQGGAAS